MDFLKQTIVFFALLGVLFVYRRPAELLKASNPQRSAVISHNGYIIHKASGLIGGFSVIAFMMPVLFSFLGAYFDENSYFY